MCAKTYLSVCPDVPRRAVPYVSGEHSQSSRDPSPQHRRDLVEQMITDYLHGGSGEAEVCDSQPSGSLTCPWTGAMLALHGAHDAISFHIPSFSLGGEKCRSYPRDPFKCLGHSCPHLHCQYQGNCFQE